MRPMLLACALFLALAPAAPALAQPSDRGLDKDIIASQGFLAGHPDMRFRLAGLRAYRKGNYTEAMNLFRRAARFGDKPSQGMLAEMYWAGQGVESDPALAYAWMDLAGERRYPMMLAKRESYWEKLDEATRARALEVGAGIYAEYGDDVARPRLERELRRARSQATGSRLGFVGSIKIYLPTPNGDVIVDGASYYDKKFWDIEKYTEWHDAEWVREAEGTVDVGELMSAGTALSEDDAALDAALDEALYEVPGETDETDEAGQSGED